MRSRQALSMLAIACATTCLSAHAQQPFRSGVDVVRVDALVTEGRRPIAGLRVADFELRDNGVLQRIDSAALESLPLSVILVLDTSGSVAGDKMQHLTAAVGALLRGLRAQDRAALVTFSHRLWLPTPLTSNLEQIRAVLQTVAAQGGTALKDAVYAGLALSDTEDSKPLVLVFSDGIDNASWLDTDDVERTARRADAVVYGVAVGADVIRFFHQGWTETRTEYLPGQTAFLDSITETTGGRVIKADSTNNLPKAFDEILREFRTRYFITYTPRDVAAAGWHTIELKVKGRRAQVRARRGYERQAKF
jgi:Ca-activated chloride channel family protein